MNTTAKETAVQKILNKSENNIYSFSDDFKQIIINQCERYDKGKAGLKSFLEDMQKGGCQSGMIGDFICHSDCKEFYVKHIEDLEEFKTELEEQLGEPIVNRQKMVHYMFVVLLCFEEFCYDIYRTNFDN